MDNLKIASLILMGGQNKRMQGQHKAFLTLNNQTFLEIITETLSSFAPIYLSVNDQTKFSQLHWPLIQDQYEAIGPLGGIYSALKTVPEDYLFVTACDMPFLTKSFANYLVSKLTPASHGIFIQNSEGFCYPLGAIYSKAMLPYMEQMLQTQCYRLQQLIKHSTVDLLPIEEIPFDPMLFTNVNTPNDYEQMKLQFSKLKP